MLVTNGTRTRRYEERVRDGVPRLGRHQVLDARSLEHTIERELAELPEIHIEPASYPAAIPVMDQGHVGSCTGNAGTYALSALAGRGNLAAVALAGHRLSGDAVFDEEFALELYHEATLLNGTSESYPPDDTGSSGLAVCQALKAAGQVGGYTWATTLRGVGVLLQRGGVLVGIPWYEAWFQANPGGFIDEDPSWPTSGVAGGHEIYVEALEAWDDHDPSRSIIRFRNSWGTSWGDYGFGRMRLSTYVLLHREIDVKQLVDFHA